MKKIFGFSNPEEDRFGEGEVQESSSGGDPDDANIDSLESSDEEISSIEPLPLPMWRRLWPER